MWIAIEYSYKLGQKSEFKFWCELGWFLQRQSHIGMPWFHRTLTSSVAKDFEVRICKDAGEDVAIEKLEIYVLSS